MTSQQVNVGKPADAELSSWKEIAAHLKVSVRTAQKWESQRGLPVRRLPGAARGRVLCSVAELEAWKRGTEAAVEVGRSRWKWVTAAIAVVACPAVAVWYFNRPGVPFAVKAEGRILAVSDTSGRELWRAILPDAALADRFAPRSWVGDVDGDGRIEVLFAHAPAADQRAGSVLCYSDSGKLKWRFVPGHAVSSSRERFDPPFIPHALAVVGLGVKRMIVVIAVHSLWYPSQVAVLDSGGRVLREYWHSGWLDQIAALDPENSTLVYVGGQSNAHNTATVLLLDAANLDGASSEPEHPKYQLLGFRDGVERARVLLPRSCLHGNGKHFVKHFNFDADGLTAATDGQNPADCNCYAYWRFDRKLRFLSVGAGDTYRARHEQLEAQGKLAHHYTGEESEFQAPRYLTGP